MRIMVFMTKRDVAPLKSDSSQSGRPSVWSASRWFLGGIGGAWLLASSSASAAPLASQTHGGDFIGLSAALSAIPAPNTLCPVVGVVAAIVFTHVLRRRRMAQLAAMELDN